MLYERLAPALYSWAVLRAPVGLEPGDLMGEVWLNAVRSRARYDAERASFRAWLFGVAKKVLLQLRELARREDLDARRCGAGSSDLERVPESVTSLSQRIERDELVNQFLGRMDRLERDERDLVIYCGLEGHGCAEAALRLGLSEDAATKRWQRLRAELRDSSWTESLLA